MVPRLGRGEVVSSVMPVAGVTMSVETIAVVLGRLQDDPENSAAWDDLAEAVTAPGVANDEAERILGHARAKHEQRHEWLAVARLLELELSFATGTPVEAPMQAELVRVYHDELFDMASARRAAERLLALRPDDVGVQELLESDAGKVGKWADLVKRYDAEADSTNDDAFKSALHASSADVAYRYGPDDEPSRAAVLEKLEMALRLDPSNVRAGVLAELLYTRREAWADVARVQGGLMMNAPSKGDRLAASLRLGRVASKRLGDTARAIAAFEQTLDLSPGHSDALAALAESYGAAEQWDHLVTLYEDQLRGTKGADELGTLVQIAMTHWRMRGQPGSAEPYFDRVRRADPAHAGMLAFFREQCEAKGDMARLAIILSDAQRATENPADKAALAAEAARLAESQENATKAIEQYKTVLRSDPENGEAREALKRLYLQAEIYPALIELLRQDLERLPVEDAAARVVILRQVAELYRDKLKNESARITTLTQIVQLDDQDIDAIRELTRAYESLGRFRDLLLYQQKLADLSTNPAEKAALYRAAARRWADQFSNVQNAISAYEGLLAVEPADGEAQEKLRELYLKRRAWPQLYALYERQLTQAEGAAKIELLLEMARLAAERLDHGEEAIALQKQVLELDPAASGVLDSLEKQAEREKDFATVAEVLERRVDGAEDDAARITILQKLGAVYADRLKDSAQAARAWRRVLELSPGHAKALRVLREGLVADGDYDGLEQLYASQNDWEGLADYLSSAADKTDDPALKMDISFRAARVYEAELGAPERAARSYDRVLSVAPDSVRAAAALAPIYESDEKWARLPALYEILLGSVESVDEQVKMLRKLAAVSGGPLGDKAAALGYARRAYELSSDAEGLDLLEAWSRAAGAWVTFVEAVEARLKKKKGLTSNLRRALRLKLAELYARELGKLDDAVAVYRELVESDPTDLETMRAFDGLLRASGRQDDLRWLFQLRVEQVGGEARAELLGEWALLEEEVLGDVPQAIALFRQMLAIAPSSTSALRALSRLLVATGDHAGAAQMMASLRDVSEGSERVRREIELAAIYLEPLDRPTDALEACVRALELSPNEPAAVELLAKLVDRSETRARAAEILEGEYAQSGDGRREAQALRVMLETPGDGEARKALFLKLMEVEESKLGAPEAALTVAFRALNEFPGDLPLWDRAGELALTSGRTTELAEAYRTHLVVAAGDATGDAHALPQATLLELCERAASLHDDKLGDPEGAKPYLERVLGIDPTNKSAFDRLKQILTSAERWGELEVLYDQAAQGTTDQIERIELLNELALIAEEIIGDPGKSISYYERITALDPLHEPALNALEKLYESEGRWKQLALLLEQRIGTAVESEAADYELRLGRIYLDKLNQPELALPRLEDVLRLREADPEARQLVERLLDVESLRMRAARVLEVVYDRRDEIRNLVRVLDIRREGSSDVHEKRELLRRVSVLRDERLRDDQGAFAALAELVPQEPEDASLRDRLVEIGRRLGEHDRIASVLTAAADACDVPATAGEILTRVAQIAGDMLADVERSEGIYRRILALDPTDPALVIPAARALGEIYASSGRAEELVGVLALEVRLEESLTARRALYERIGTLYETELDDPKKAIEALRARLDDDSTDEEALGALERLYEKIGESRELVSVLRAREQCTSDAGERQRVMVKAAAILADKLDSLPEAIDAYTAVLDELGPQRSTLAALAGLYERSERWAELGEILEVDLSVSEETADRIALLARLGDLRRQHRDDLQGALDAYREALELDPTDARCRAALESLLDVADARRDAAEILTPLYEADGDSERLLKVLDIEAELADSPSDKLHTFEKALRTAEGPLTDPKRAFAYAVRGVREAVGEDSIASWIETAERLAGLSDRFVELSELYRAVVDDILDGDVQQDLELRIGELARTKLGDSELAIVHYKKALDAHGDDRRPMVALDELYEAEDRSAELLEILKLRVEAAESDSERTLLLFRVARLQKGPLEDSASAIATYEAILDVALDPAAISALVLLYTSAERWTDLISLYERELDATPPAAADLHVKIAALARRHMSDIDRAFDELAAALEADQNHELALAELEQILGSDDPAHRARAGEILEPVYLRRSDWGRVKTALLARLAESQDPSERSDLLTRLATLYEEQLEDYRAALDTVALLLHEDRADERVWRELERLAKVGSAEKRLAEIFAKELSEVSVDDESSAKLARRAGELYAELGDVPNALLWYQRAHAFEPESRELFDAIDALFVKESRHRERVELYRAGLSYCDDAERLEALHIIAQLERTELMEPEKAVETYVAALDIDADDVRALDALTELYRDLDRSRELADLYLRRAESASNAEQGAPYRLALARLLATKLEDAEGAIDQLDAIVGEVPWHEGAIKELEALAHSEEHKARVVEILRPLYERKGDWRLLVRLNEERLLLAVDPQDKVAVLRETALLLETRGSDRAGAFATMTTAFLLDPEDVDTRADLERLAEALGAWSELAGSYEEGVRTAQEDVVRRDLLGRLAKVYDQRIDDPRRALGALSTLAELDPTDPEPLAAMDTLALLLGDWTTLIAVLEKEAELASDEETAAIWRRIADTKLEMLLDEAGATAAYERSLELDPSSTSTLDSLIDLHEARENAARLVELYPRRVELASADEAELRYELNIRCAKCHEGPLNDRHEAIVALEAALSARPSDAAALSALERLYRAESMWDELLGIVKQRAALADSNEARVELRNTVADLYAKELGSPSDALETYRLVFEDGAAPSAGDASASTNKLESAANHAVQAVHAIAEAHEDLRLDAIEILEPVLRAAGQSAELVKVLELRLRAQSEPADRAATLRTIALLHEEKLGNAEAASSALLRALGETPGDASLHDELDRLAAKSGGFGPYADALEQQASSAFDGSIAQDLWTRLGSLAEAHLKDDARAVSAYARAVEHAGDVPELLASLDRLYLRLGDYKALTDILERRISVAGDDRTEADLYHRLAVIQIDQFHERAQGLGRLRMALERAIDHDAARQALEKLAEDRELFEEAAEVLEGVYRARGDNAALTQLHERRIGFATSASDRVRMRLDLARLLEDRASDAKGAQTTLEHAMNDDPTDEQVLSELERLAPITNGWPSAADALEKALHAHADLGTQALTALFVRLASWRKDRCDDAAGAERALNRALLLDATSEDVLRRIEALQRVPGREADLVATLRKLAAIDPTSDRAAELLREAKTLAECSLSDNALAEAILRDMLATNDADTWALAELTRLRELASDWQEAFTLLVRRGELEPHGEKSRVLRHLAAEIAKDKLADLAGSIALYEQIFEDEPKDAKAASTLRELYTKGAKHRELLSLIGRLIDLAESPGARAELRLESAKLCAEHLDATVEAIDHLRAVLDEDPSHAAATLLLSQLLEKAGRDDELAELLSSQIELAKERKELDRELTFSVRLGEVAESRLNDVPRAIATYRAVLERAPKHAGALSALARLYEQKGERAEAAAMLEVIVTEQAGAGAAQTALRLADLYESLKDAPALRRILEVALRTDEANRDVRERLATLYEKEQAWSELAGLVVSDAEAATEVSEKVRLFTKAAEIHTTKRSDPHAAAEQLARATALAPGDRELLLALCDAYSASGRGKQAVEALRQIVESFGGRRSKELGGIHLRLAQAYLADGDKEQALSELESAFKIDPGSIGIRRELGLLSLDLAESVTDKTEAAAHMDRADKAFKALLMQKLDDSSPISKAEVFYYLGLVCHRQGDSKKAIQQLERALDNDKELTRAKELLAELKK
jgi:tetratricopeptide (TPR) repeat protein